MNQEVGFSRSVRPFVCLSEVIAVAGSSIVCFFLSFSVVGPVFVSRLLVFYDKINE